MYIRLNIALLMIFTFTLPAFDTYTEAFSAGRSAEQQKRFAEAVNCYRKAEALAGNHYEKYDSVFRRAETFRKEKKWDEARKALQEILQINGLTPNQRGTALIYSGHYFHWEGKPDEALKIFGAVAENRKVHVNNRIDALINRGNILEQQKKYNEAVAAYEKAISIAGIPPHLQAAAYLRMASTCKKSNEYSQAYKMLEKAENIPDIPPASLSAVIIQRGELYYTEKKYREAMDEFNKIFIMDAPQRYHLDIVDWHLGNTCYHGLKDLDKAQFHYLRARKSPVTWCRNGAADMLRKIEAQKKADLK
jgi:tetratricopeptide (TPR) repeat protein